MRRLLLPAFLIAAALAQAAPDEFLVQGRLADNAGAPLTAAVSVTAELYDAPSGGTRVFGPEVHAVNAVNGVFEVRLGSVAPGLGAAVRGGPNRWLQLSVNGTPLSSRSRLASAPFALTVAAGAVGEKEIANGTVAAVDLTTSAVTGSKIAAGQVGDLQISAVSWSKVTGRPASLGGPALLSGSTVVEPVTSTINFLSPFTSSSLGAGQVFLALNPSSVTLQGNAFNQPNTLALLDGAGVLPSAQLWGAYGSLTGLGTVVSGTWTATGLAVANGGTGAATAAAARANLVAASTATLINAGTGLTGGGSLLGGWSLNLATAAVSAGCSSASQKLLWSTTTLRLECGVDADTDSTALGGDLSGTQSANTVTAIQGEPVAAAPAPANGDVLRWTGSQWQPSADLANYFGSGSANRIVKWTGVFPSSSSLGNSILTDNGTTVSVAGDLRAGNTITGGNVTSGVDPGHVHTNYALTNHTLDASRVVTGTLPSNHGGTGISVGTTLDLGGYAKLGDRGGGLVYWISEAPSAVRDFIQASQVNHTHGNFLNLNGADNYIGRFNDPGNIEASILYQDDNGRIGLGTTTPGALFHMRGTGNPMVLAESPFSSNAYSNNALLVLGGKTSLNVSVPASGAGAFTGIRAVRSNKSDANQASYGVWAYVTNGTDHIGAHGSAVGTGAASAAYGVSLSADGGDHYNMGLSAESQTTSTNYGLYGEATGAGTNYGIYATASGAGAKAGGFYGNKMHVQGALSKTGGTFDIPHPDPAKPGWRLRHSFVESPTRGDNIYRWTVDVKGGKGAVALPGYFHQLNEDVHVWVFPRDHAGRAYGRVDGLSLTVVADSDGAYNVIAVGTRKDAGAHAGFDAKGLEYRTEGGRP